MKTILTNGGCLLLLMLTATGCGLIPIPAAQRTLPEYGAIHVVDLDTGQYITNAEVAVSYNRFEEWLRDYPIQVSRNFQGGITNRITVTGKGDGMFAVDPKKARAYVKPWGMGPLGNCLYDDYSLTIAARADGYLPASFTFFPPDYVESKRTPEEDVLRFFPLPQPGSNGVLKVFLERPTHIQLRDTELEGTAMPDKRQY